VVIEMARLALTCALFVSLGINAVSQVPSPSTKANVNSGPAVEVVPTACDGANFPIDKGGSPSCCRLGSEIFHVTLLPEPFFKKIGHRQLGLACTDKYQKPNCVGMNCYFGACGAHIVETWEGTDARVFVPDKQPLACGYQVTAAE
jgi:hypothetical protein